jgi:hypothetical protein
MSCKNRRFGGTYRLHHQVEKNQQLLVTANDPSWLILFNLKMEAIPPSDSSVLTRVTRRHVPENVIFNTDVIAKSYSSI